MLGSRGRMSAVMASVAMMSAVGTSAQAMEVTPTWSLPRTRNSAGTGFMLYATSRSSGKTAAQQKRASKKARNVKRHKQNTR